MHTGTVSAKIAHGYTYGTFYEILIIVNLCIQIAISSERLMLSTSYFHHVVLHQFSV